MSKCLPGHSFIVFLFVRAVKALLRQHGCEPLSEPLLLVYSVSNKSSSTSFLTIHFNAL